MRPTTHRAENCLLKNWQKKSVVTPDGAPSGVSPDFFCQLFENAVLRPMGGRSHTVLECTTRWSRRAGCLFSVILPSRRAIIAPALGSLALRFGATTVLLPGRSWRVNNGGIVAWTLSSRVSNWVLRAGEVDATEDKFGTLTPCKLFDACFRARSLADANE